MHAMRNALEHRADQTGAKSDPVDQFPAAIKSIAEQHRPSRMPFFVPGGSARVGREQSVASRPDPSGIPVGHACDTCGGLLLPHLDSPAMRKRKLQIFIDDDGLPGGDTHHYQLTGRSGTSAPSVFSKMKSSATRSSLCRHLDKETAHFVQLASSLYARSLGPWCAVEVMSDDWMRALANALAVHFPGDSSTSPISRNASRKAWRSAMPRNRLPSPRWYPARPELCPRHCGRQGDGRRARRRVAGLG